MNALQGADTRTLYRAWDRLRRLTGDNWTSLNMDKRPIVLMAMARELRRRGWRSNGTVLWC
jgi:hypothetical protein